MLNILLHLMASFLLFYLVNWIGKHSVTVGYMQLSMFLRNDEAPAFNLLFRILTPIVYILILSYLFYLLELNNLVRDIYWVVFYYFLFRFFINIIFGRFKLINWTRQISLAFISIFLSYWIYQSIIIKKSNLMPDFSTISNEIWLIVIFFIYQIFNKVSVPSEATKRRKNNYLKNRYTRYYNKYNSLISERVNDKKIEALVYTIMLYEAFNRPKFVRIIENLVFKFKKTGSLGIMQVKSNNLINDKRSVEIGVEKILNDYNQNLKEREETSEEYIIRNTISNYNGGSQYLEEICELYDSITFYFYKNVHEKFKLSY